MTIYNTLNEIYFKVMEENSFRALKESKVGHNKKHSARFSELEERYCIKTWDKFTCQIIDQFGVSNEIKLIYYKQNTINRLEIAMLCGGQNEETLIEILKSDIELLKNRISEKAVSDLKQHHNRLRRILEEHYKRDPRKLTIFEFHSDLNDLKIESEQVVKKDMPRKVANG